MKQCKCCDVELVVGENITKSRFKNWDYKCNSCNSQYFKGWYKENSSYYTSYRKQNLEHIQKYIKSYNIKDGLGIYVLYYRWLCLYVGEGKLKGRQVNHFSKVGKYGSKKEANSSKVATLLTERNLPRKYLSFKVLEYEDDTSIRKQRETHYRRELKPFLNPL